MEVESSVWDTGFPTGLVCLPGSLLLWSLRQEIRSVISILDEVDGSEGCFDGTVKVLTKFGKTIKEIEDVVKKGDFTNAASNTEAESTPAGPSEEIDSGFESSCSTDVDDEDISIESPFSSIKIDDEESGKSSSAPCDTTTTTISASIDYIRSQLTDFRRKYQFQPDLSERRLKMVLKKTKNLASSSSVKTWEDLDKIVSELEAAVKETLETIKLCLAVGKISDKETEAGNVDTERELGPSLDGSELATFAVPRKPRRSTKRLKESKVASSPARRLLIPKNDPLSHLSRTPVRSNLGLPRSVPSLLCSTIPNIIRTLAALKKSSHVELGPLCVKLLLPVAVSEAAAPEGLPVVIIPSKGTVLVHPTDLAALIPRASNTTATLYFSSYLFRTPISVRLLTEEIYLSRSKRLLESPALYTFLTTTVPSTTPTPFSLRFFHHHRQTSALLPRQYTSKCNVYESDLAPVEVDPEIEQASTTNRTKATTGFIIPSKISKEDNGIENGGRIYRPPTIRRRDSIKRKRERSGTLEGERKRRDLGGVGMRVCMVDF